MKKLPVLLGLAGFIFLASANAQLAHRYSMTTDGTDSVGGANGAVSGSGATFSGGFLNTAGTDFLALPTTAVNGITGNFSIQTFVTLGANPGNYSSLFSFASPGNRNFLLLNPSRPGNGGGNLSANFQQSNGPDIEKDLVSGAPFPFGTTEHDVMLTYVASSNTATVYLDGTQVVTGSIASAVNTGANFNLQAVASGGNNGINGGGPFGDPSLNGSTDDFRIYSSALSAAQVSALDLAGPNASNATIAGLVPEPSTWVTMLMSLVVLCGLQRFRGSRA